MIDPLTELILSMFTPGPCGVLHTGNNIRECKTGWVYIAKCDDLYKIGRSSQQRQYLGVRNRIKSLNQLTQKEFVFYRSLYTCCVVGFEKYLHEKFRNPVQGQEIFRLSVSDLLFIESISEFAGQPVQHILTAP